MEHKKVDCETCCDRRWIIGFRGGDFPCIRRCESCNSRVFDDQAVSDMTDAWDAMARALEACSAHVWSRGRLTDGNDRVEIRRYAEWQTQIALTLVHGRDLSDELIDSWPGADGERQAEAAVTRVLETYRANL